MGEKNIEMPASDIFHHHWTKRLSFVGVLVVCAFVTVSSDATHKCDQFCNKAEYCNGPECFSCEEGTFQSSGWHKESECKKHTPKPSGLHWVLMKKGTDTSDNVWECKEGYVRHQYSSLKGHYECRPTSSSTPGLPDNETSTGYTPTLIPVLQNTSSLNGANLEKKSSDFVGYVVGVIVLVAVLIFVFCFRKKIRSMFCNRQHRNNNLPTEENERFMSGSVSNDQDNGSRNNNPDGEQPVHSDPSQTNPHNSLMTDSNSNSEDRQSRNDKTQEKVQEKELDSGKDTDVKQFKCNREGTQLDIGNDADVKQQGENTNVKKHQCNQDNVPLHKDLSQASQRYSSILDEYSTKYKQTRYANFLFSEVKEDNAKLLFLRLEKVGYIKPNIHLGYTKDVSNREIPVAAHKKTLLDYMQNCCIQNKPFIADVKKILKELDQNEILENVEFIQNSKQVQDLFDARIEAAEIICKDLEKETCHELLYQMRQTQDSNSLGDKFESITEVTDQKRFILLMDELDDMAFMKQLEIELGKLSHGKENDKLINKIKDVYSKHMVLLS